MIRLEMLHELAIEGTLCRVGSIIEADGELARRLLELGVAVPAEARARHAHEARRPRHSWITEW